MKYQIQPETVRFELRGSLRMLTLVNMEFFFGGGPSFYKEMSHKMRKKITLGGTLLSSHPCVLHSRGEQVLSSAVNHDLTPLFYSVK